jgi:hypothetical protein
MEKSKFIAGIVGPTLILMVTSELKLWNPTLYNNQITPLVYLTGVLFFVAGISIVRNHNIWVKGWQTGITLIGWLSIILGTIRMFFPQTYLTQVKNDSFTLIIEVILILYGAYLTYKAFSKRN